jgi:hypothetical protein
MACAADLRHLRAMQDTPGLRWAPVGSFYSDLTGEEDDWVAVDAGDQVVASVRRHEHGPEAGQWQWSLFLVHPGPAFNRPTNGTCPTGREAVDELATGWQAFRKYYEIEE